MIASKAIKPVVMTISMVAVAAGIWAVSPVSASSQSHIRPIRFGAIYPLTTGGGPARDEYHGLRIALGFVNNSGGVGGRPIHLVLKNVAGGDQAPEAVSRLQQRRVIGIVGSESSLVGIPASEAANAHGVFYLEGGAVATMLTARGLPNVFRTVTTGQTLGRSAARFSAATIAPRLHKSVHSLRVAVVYIRDVYGESVGKAQIAETRKLGMHLVGVFPYNYPGVSFPALVRKLKAARPDVVLVAAYRPDAIHFRRETIRQHLRVGAMIGTSSSFCMMAFARALGVDAVGLFAADKPDGSVNSRALDPAARALRARAEGAYRSKYGKRMSAPAVAGFVAGWILFHDILPHARNFSTSGLRASALALNLPAGSEINGAGVRFARPSQSDGGQNLRAVSVVWQWQHPDKAVIVSPPQFATGTPRFIPLPLR